MAFAFQKSKPSLGALSKHMQTELANLEHIWKNTSQFCFKDLILVENDLDFASTKAKDGGPKGTS